MTLLHKLTQFFETALDLEHAYICMTNSLYMSVMIEQ